jgi:hypothetical protein
MKKCFYATALPYLGGATLAKSKVLFLYNHNSARSQMTEGLLRHFHGGRYEAFSAGSSSAEGWAIIG